MPPIDDGDGHRFRFVLLHVSAPTLAGYQQFGDLVAVDDLAPVKADVVASGHLVLSDHPTEGIDVTTTVPTVPLRNRQLVQIDVVAFDDVLFDWTGIDHARRDGILECLSKVTHDVRIAGALGQSSISWTWRRLPSADVKSFVHRVFS